MKQFLGNHIGVRLTDRGPKDRHQQVTILIEDDGNWIKETIFSNFWLDEAIEQLNEAKRYFKTNCKKTKWGYERKLKPAHKSSD